MLRVFAHSCRKLQQWHSRRQAAALVGPLRRCQGQANFRANYAQLVRGTAVNRRRQGDTSHGDKRALTDNFNRRPRCGRRRRGTTCPHAERGTKTADEARKGGRSEVDGACFIGPERFQPITNGSSAEERCSQMV